MEILDPGTIRRGPIHRFESLMAAAAPVAHGDGEAHAYIVCIDAGGRIGEHPAGFGQLFIVVEGSGWIAGSDGVRRPLATGMIGYVARGETHSKGSEEGMTAIMLQVRDLNLTEDLKPPAAGRGEP